MFYRVTMKRTAISIIISIIGLTLSAQGYYNESYSYFNFSLGANTISPTVHNAPEIDDYSNRSIMRLEIGHTFKYGIGGYISVSGMGNTESDYRLPPFIDNNVHNAPDSDEISFSATETKFNAGVTYHIRFGKFSATPMLGAGISRRSGHNLRKSYKSLTSTDITQYDLRIGGPKWVPILSPGCRFTYHPNSFLGLTLGAEYTVCLRHRDPSTITVTDAYTGNETAPEIKLNSKSPLTVLLGISFFI